jgi:hypothetical protein
MDIQKIKQFFEQLQGKPITADVIDNATRATGCDTDSIPFYIAFAEFHNINAQRELASLAAVWEKSKAEKDERKQRTDIKAASEKIQERLANLAATVETAPLNQITASIADINAETAGLVTAGKTKSPIVTYEGYRQRRANRKYWEEFTPALFNRLPFPDGSVNLIGARSGAGKTNALINIMRELLETAAPDTVTNNKHREQLKNASRRMVFISREMIADDILDRLTLSLSWAIKDSFPYMENLKEDPFLNLQKFHTSQKYPDIPPEETYNAYSYVLEKIINPAIKSGRLVILDAVEMETLEEILLDSAVVHIGQGDIVLIDYIQILPAATNKEAERYATADHLRMRYIIFELRKAAKNSGAIFICASQLNREAAKMQAEGKTNIETAFKDSADLEQAAHSAVIIDRKDGKGKEQPSLSYHVVKARSSHHLGQRKNIDWKPGFYHMELKKTGDADSVAEPTLSSGNMRTIKPQ